MRKAKRKRAPTPSYISPNQLSLETFASPFAQRLKQDNRWVVLGDLIPGDDYPATYIKEHQDWLIVTDEDTIRTPINI